MIHASSILNTEHSVTDFDSQVRLIVPDLKSERDRLLSLVETYVAEKQQTPPLSQEELRHHTDDLLEKAGIPIEYKDFVTVLLNNEVWKATVASVPFERRVLLIPQCLRASKACQAELDEFGLLCEQCNACSIGGFQAVAEDLGYVVLVAEGTTVVTRLIESGKIDAVIGISCLSVLEKTFQHMSSGAVPGIAIPLIIDGCNDTRVDEDWVYDAIRLKSADSSFEQIDIPKLYDEVKSWFEYDYLVSLLGRPASVTEEIAVKWLAKSGKRWRPFLAAAVFNALKGNSNGFDETIQKLAVAVECFHKASLIHDDIEDGDDFRYGEASLHKEQGIAIALNIGDLLLGEGYRMIAECGADSAKIAEMLQIAAEGHRTLCLGQGEELWMEKDPELPSRSKLIDVFKWKTSPAFEVALQLGAIYAGENDNIRKVLHEFSESLGIAYQIRDDIDDFSEAMTQNDTLHLRSSLLFALAAEVGDSKNMKIFSSISGSESLGREVFNTITEMNVEEKAAQLCEHYKNRAIRSLSLLQNTQLKSLMRKIISKILGKT
jgi:geranylgeranyl pyrophosphate synthase